MDRLDLLTEQCDICSQSAREDDCKDCEKRKEIKYLLEKEKAQPDAIIVKNEVWKQNFTFEKSKSEDKQMDDTILVSRDFLLRIRDYIKDMEVEFEIEHGCGREFEELLEEDEVNPLYHEVDKLLET